MSRHFLRPGVDSCCFCVKVKRVYLVHITQLEPRRLDLETVWVLDGETRSIYKAQVDRNTDSQDPAEMILRIRYVLLRLKPCWCQHASTHYRRVLSLCLADAACCSTNALTQHPIWQFVKYATGRSSIVQWAT